MYYLSYPKLGRVFQWSSEDPHIDYSVQPHRISVMLSSGRVTVEKVREEYITQARGPPRLFDGLSRLEQEREGDESFVLEASGGSCS